MRNHRFCLRLLLKISAVIFADGVEFSKLLNTLYFYLNEGHPFSDSHSQDLSTIVAPLLRTWHKMDFYEYALSRNHFKSFVFWVATRNSISSRFHFPPSEACSDRPNQNPWKELYLMVKCIRILIQQRKFKFLFNNRESISSGKNKTTPYFQLFADCELRSFTNWHCF